MRSIKELSVAFKDAWDNIFFGEGYFNTLEFIDWLFDQDFDMLDYAHMWFSSIKKQNERASVLGCEYIEYVMTHKELISIGFSSN